MLTCTEETGRRILRLAGHCLRKFRSHPMYDDLQSACVLHALECLDRLPPGRHNDAFGIVVIAIGQWVRRFFTGPACDLAFRHTSQRGQPIPRPVTWEELEREWTGAERERRAAPYAERRGPFPAVEPDFAPRVIAALHRAAVLREAWALLSDEERAIAAAWAGGETLERIARRRGITKDRAQRLLQHGLNHYRERHGLPLLKDGTRRYDHAQHPEKQALMKARATARYRVRRADPAQRAVENARLRARRARQREERQCRTSGEP